MTTISGHTTRANGTILTAAIYNNDHLNHVANAVALNAGKVEGGTPPVVDGQLIVWDGTDGTRIRTSGLTPYVAGGSDVAIADGGTGQSTALAAFNALKQDGTDVLSGVFEKATDAEYRSAVANKAVTTDLIESASATVTLTDAGTIAVDWDTFINAVVTLAGNRSLGNPTNGQPGTWRTILVQQDAVGGRTLSYGGQYVKPGGTAITVTATANAVSRLSIYCRSATVFELYPIGLGLA